MSFPRIHSFYVPEGEMSATLRLVALKDLQDKRSVTTLLRKGSALKAHRDLCVLVLVKGSEIVQVDSNPVASSQGSRLWNEHAQGCDQAHESIAAKTPKAPETPIDRWVSEVTDADVQVDAFRPESVKGMQHSVSVGVASTEPALQTKKPTTKRARTGRGNLDALHKSFSESRHGQGGKEARIQESVASFGDLQTTGDRSTGEEGWSHCQPPSIEPPYLPPLALPSRSLSTTPSRTSKQPTPSSLTWGIVTRGNKSGTLVDMSMPSDGRAKDEAMVVIDHLQDTTKDKARDLKSTMHQRKAPRLTSVGGDTALIRSFEEPVTHLLSLALHRSGQIGFAVDIGRLLVKQQCRSDFQNKNFRTSEFSAVLPKGGSTDFEPIFTNMLTARSTEAESIVNITLSRGRRLFQQRPVSRKVTYIFSCRAKGGDQIILESDENGNFSVSGLSISSFIYSPPTKGDRYEGLRSFWGR